MFIDPTEKLLDIDNEPIMVEQKLTLPDGAVIARVGGKQVVLDKDSKVIASDDKKFWSEGKPLTFGDMTVTIALSQLEGDDKLSGAKRMDRMELAEKFHKAVLPVEINNDQAKVLEELAEKTMPVLTFSRYVRIIRTAQAKKADAKS